MGIKYDQAKKHYVVTYSRRHPVTRIPRSLRRQGIKTKPEAERVYRELIIKLDENEYKDEFVSIAKVDVSLDGLLEVRAQLVQGIKNALTENDKKFLISFVSNKPDWSLVRDDKIKDFPSVKWKLMNQGKMDQKKLNLYVQKVGDSFKK